MPFSGPFTVTSPRTLDSTQWSLENDFSWSSRRGVVTVPAGFQSDGTSAPRYLWWWIPPMDGRVTRASLIHDHLYTCLENDEPHPVAPTRREADEALYEAALEAGMSRLSATFMWLGVRLFGRSHAVRPKPTSQDEAN